jgi:hypothetical protein
MIAGSGFRLLALLCVRGSATLHPTPDRCSHFSLLERISLLPRPTNDPRPHTPAERWGSGSPRLRQTCAAHAPGCCTSAVQPWFTEAKEENIDQAGSSKEHVVSERHTASILLYF